MKAIKVCIGSACHLKGSYEVLEGLKQLIEEYGLQEQIEIQAAFCLKNCMQGVSVMRWDEKVLSVSKENVRAIFETEMMEKL